MKLRCAVFAGLCCTGLLLSAGAAHAADADSLYGIHWWGHEGPGNPIDPTPASLLNSASQGAYDTEIVNTHDGYFWSADWIKPLYLDLFNVFQSLLALLGMTAGDD